MSNVGRILTLVIEIQTSEYPKWITDAHIHQAQGGANSVKVKAISEGNIINKHTKLEEACQEHLMQGEYPDIDEALEE